MSISWFSVIILLIVAVVAFIEIYRGIRRGFFPTLISLGVMIPSILAALLIAPPIARGIVAPVFENMIQPSYLYQMLLVDFNSMGPFLQAAAQMVVSLLLFVVCFAVLHPLLRLVFYSFTIDSRASRGDDPGYCCDKVSFCHRYSRTLGGITGGVCALIISMVITCPFMGSLRVAGDVIDMAEEFEPNLWSMTTLSAEDVDTIKSLPDDLPGNVLYELGGKYMFRAAAQTKVYGERVYLHTELEHVESIFSQLPAAFAILEHPTEVTSEQIAQLKTLRDHFNQLKLCHGVVSDYFAYCAKTWLAGSPYYSFSQPQLHPIAQPLMNEILLVCAESTADTVKSNVTTLLNAYILHLESNLLTVNANNYSELLSCLEESQLIPKLETELAKNPNMAHIRISVVSLQLWSTALKTLKLPAAALSDFYDHMAVSLNTVHNRGYGSSQEQVSVLRTYMNKYLTERQLSLPDFLCDAIVTELVSLSPEEGEFTGAQIEAFFQQYT
jgi:hypothetical protein